jgi:hypothetical protein
MKREEMQKETHIIANDLIHSTSEDKVLLLLFERYPIIAL